MSSENPTASTSTYIQDLVAGLVVFLVALPLCLGIALASGADLFSGLLAGIIGGIVVGAISGSHTSVSGPAAGMTAIVAAQITTLGSFEAFLLAVAISGLIQIAFGVAKGGALSAFFPSSVINGLLVAIGVILILKQIPHVLGRDTDPEGDMAFLQPDSENTFSELWITLAGSIHTGAMVIGLVSLAVLVLWDRIPVLKKSLFPSALLVVLIGVAMNAVFIGWGGQWAVGGTHLVEIPVAKSATDFASFLTLPDFSQFANPQVYIAAMTLAIVASLMTLLNVEAVDKIDPLQRRSPPSRELIAQGCGNVLCGLIGGLPLSSVIVRSSVNVDAGAKTKSATIIHGVLLLVSVAFMTQYLNMIPLSALAAILLVTGYKLASPQLISQMWRQGRYQFVPFILTVIAIVLTDLLIGVLIGLGIAVVFILNSNLRRPIRHFVESKPEGEVTRVELANQVSFLNRAAIHRVLDGAKPGSHWTIDARQSDYIDPDVLSLIRDFAEHMGPARDVSVNLVGFRSKYRLGDEGHLADAATRKKQQQITPDQVLEFMREGNRRFVDGNRLNRDFGRQICATATGQFPFAAVLSCIDSRVPTELVFDLGVGDIFSVRVAGNVIGTKSLGSLEYAVGVAGVKLVVVLGHTNCGAVTSSVKLVSSHQNAMKVTGCEHLQAIVDEIAPSIAKRSAESLDSLPAAELTAFIDDVAKRNVLHTVAEITRRSTVIRNADEKGQINVIGAMYDVRTGAIQFLDNETTALGDEPVRKLFADSSS